MRELDLGFTDLTDEGLSLTNYELVLPGVDKILGTDDDLRIRDGVIAEGARPDVKAAVNVKVNGKR